MCAYDVYRGLLSVVIENLIAEQTTNEGAKKRDKNSNTKLNTINQFK